MMGKYLIGNSFLLVTLIGVSSAILTVEVEGQISDTYPMYGLFDTPYANLGDKTIKGYLYYHDTGCDELIPAPLRTLNRTNTSILLVANYSDCILNRIVLAKQAGYDALLSFTVDDSNTSIPRIVIQTGFPIAIVQSKIAKKLINNATVTEDNTDTQVSITGHIFSGIMVVASAVMFGAFCCLFICVGSISGILSRDKSRNAFQPITSRRGNGGRLSLLYYLWNRVPRL